MHVSNLKQCSETLIGIHFAQIEFNLTCLWFQKISMIDATKCYVTLPWHQLNYVGQQQEYSTKINKFVMRSLLVESSLIKNAIFYEKI